MKLEISKILFALITVVLLAAVQEMLPAFAGVKPCLMLAAVAYSASLPFAIFAGAVVEVLDALPPFCAIGFYSLVAALARYIKASPFESFAAQLLAFFACAISSQLWLDAWVQPPDVMARCAGAAVWAAPVGTGIFLLAPRLQHHCGIKI